MIQKVSKLKLDLYGKIPSSLDDIDVKELREKYPEFLFDELNYEYKGSSFTALLIHSEFQDQLARSPNCVLLADGTFSMVPKMYKQLYTSHIIVGPRSFPLSFVLSVNRPKELYLEVFKFMKEKIGCNPSVVITDFEAASRTAIREIWCTCLLKGCLFHYVQSLMRRLGELHLKNEYSHNYEFNAIIREYFALPFVPKENVSDYHQSILNEARQKLDGRLVDLFREFDAYFQSTWMNGVFMIEDWNQLGDLEHRSNNWSESFHAAFARKFSKSHPNIIQFLDTLKGTLLVMEYEYSDLLLNLRS